MGVVSNYFDAVVLFWIVTGGEICCGIVGHGTNAPIDHWRNCEADVCGFDSGFAEAAHESVLEFFTGEAIVSSYGNCFYCVFA